MSSNQPPTNPQGELRQKLAAIEHQRWADWQKYVFDMCRPQDSGRGVGKPTDLVIPSELVERWGRQINTPYPELTEYEQVSDMEQVDRYWPLIQSELDRVRAEAERVSLQAQIHDYVIGDMKDPVGTARTAALMLIAILCADTNAAEAEIKVTGLTWKGEALGDWKVSLASLTNPKGGEAPEDNHKETGE